MSKKCDACYFIDNPTHPVIRTKYWNVELGPNHYYPGRAFVTLLVHKDSLSDLSSEEWADFESLVRKLESAYTEALGATLINWACLRNNAFQEKPFNPHVHWHLVPRYEKPVEIAGETFVDEEFGHHYDFSREHLLDDATIDAIAAKVRAHL